MLRFGGIKSRKRFKNITALPGGGGGGGQVSVTLLITLAFKSMTPWIIHTRVSNILKVGTLQGLGWTGLDAIEIYGTEGFFFKLNMKE